MPSPNRRLIPILAALAIAVLSAGLYVFDSARNSERQSEGIPVNAGGERESARGSGAAPGAKSSVEVPSGPAVEDFWHALTENDEYERFARWRSHLQGLTPENALEVRGLFTKMDEQGRWFIPEWDAFWLRWGEVDAKAAMAEMKKMSAGSYEEKLMERVFRGWAKGDSAEARAWLEANASSKHFESALRGYVDGLARVDLDRATREITIFGTDKPQRAAIDALAEQALQQRQIPGMLDWWRALPENTENLTVRREAVAAVYKRLRRSTGERTGEWLRELAGTRYHCESEIADHAARMGAKDPAKALEWVKGLPPSPANGRYSGLDRALQHWAKQDREAAQSWIDRQPESAMRQQAAAALAALNRPGTVGPP